MYNLLIKQDLVSTFPNIEVTLRVYLCFMVSNCSGERTFSQLKRIKNELRSTMGQNRLIAFHSCQSSVRLFGKGFHINRKRFRTKKISKGDVLKISGIT